jgi:hypothetical protein
LPAPVSYVNFSPCGEIELLVADRSCETMLAHGGGR